MAGWGLAAITLLIGLAATANGIWNLNKSWSSESWPSVPGKILGSEIRRNSHESRHGPGGKLKNSDMDYVVEVRYSYEIDGRSLEGNRLRFGSKSQDQRAKAEQEKRLYATGKEVRVYYDPENPKNASLITGFEGWLTKIVVPAIILLIGLVLGIFMIRVTGTPQTQPDRRPDKNP